MSGIELAIRPFANPTGTTASQTVPPSGPTPSPSNVHLRIGRDGGAKTFHGSASLSTTVYVKKWPKETDTEV